MAACSVGDMPVDIRTVLRKHEGELRRFRRGLFSADPADSELASSLPSSVLERYRVRGLAVPHSFGPVRSVTDRFATLSFGGDISDQAALLEQPGREGSLLAVGRREAQAAWHPSAR